MWPLAASLFAGRSGARPGASTLSAIAHLWPADGDTCASLFPAAVRDGLRFC
jgi:hypothetical protein